MPRTRAGCYGTRGLAAWLATAQLPHHLGSFSRRHVAQVQVLAALDGLGLLRLWHLVALSLQPGPAP